MTRPTFEINGTDCSHLLSRRASPGKVDVLALMDLAIARAQETGGPGLGCIAARAVVERLIDALELAERTIAGTLTARGYAPGSCTDEWAPEVRAELAALVPVRAALAMLP